MGHGSCFGLANVAHDSLYRDLVGAIEEQIRVRPRALRRSLTCKAQTLPCFRSTGQRCPQSNEVGFDPAVLGETRRIVRGIVRGSAAEAAGLRNGDEIVKPVPQDQIQGDQKMIQTLEVKRGGRTFQISYLPRGEPVEVYQWQRVDSVPDRKCVR